MNLKDYLHIFKQLDENKQSTDNLDLQYEQEQKKSKKQTEQQVLPLSGYLRFYLQKEAQLKEQYPDFSNIEIIQIIVKQWRQLSQVEREMFRDPDGQIKVYQLDSSEQDENEDFHININD